MWSGADASYLAAITAASRKYSWHGTVTDIDGVAYSFTAGDIVQGSGQLSRMVSSATSLDIGTVYTAQLTIRLYKAINRYKLYNGTIDLYCDVDVSGVTYSVPMGVFRISECTQEISCISITAYDYMTMLDEFLVATDQGQDEAYDWIAYLCSLCGVTLATTRAEVEAMPNGTEPLTFKECDTPLSSMTCRDALSYLCACIGACAYIDRSGHLVIQQYGMTAVDDIAANERFSSSLSDYTTHYSAVTLGVFADRATEYYPAAVDDGMTYDLGTNPWLQFGLQTARDRVCTAIAESLALVSYVPFTAAIPLRPELDPMDVLTFSGNQASSDLGGLTALVYKLGGQMQIKCSGGNPRLAGAKSKASKELAALANRVTDLDFYTYYFENTSQLILNQVSAQIASIAVMTVKEARMTMIYTITHTSGNRGRFYIDVYINGSLYKTYHDAFFDGSNVTTFHITFNIVQAQINYIMLYLRTEGYATFTLDGTWNSLMEHTWDALSGLTWEDLTEYGTHSENPPTIQVAPGYSQLTVFGRGLAAVEVWDGQIVVSDDLEAIEQDYISDLTELSALTTYTPEDPGVFADVQNLVVDDFIDSMTDAALFQGGFMLYNAYINQANISTSGVTLTNGVWYGSGELDDGTEGYLIIGDDIYTSGITTITAIDNGGYWQLSFDGGVTWEGCSGGVWSSSTIMTTAQLSALTNADLTAKGSTVQIKVLLEENCNARSVTVEGGTV